MADMQWELIIPALLGGAILGALLTGLLRKRPAQKRRDQAQPIGLRMVTNPIFPALKHEGASDAKAVLKYDDVTFLASRVFLVELQVVNMGTKNFPEFTFGISLPTRHHAIASICEPPDRMHAVEEKPSVAPKAWAKEVDFTLRPFNKHDSYVLKLYVHVGGESGELGEDITDDCSACRVRRHTRHHQEAGGGRRLIGPCYS